MKIISIEIWVVLQLFIDLILVTLVFYLLKSLKTMMQRDVSKEVYEEVVKMIEPLLIESKQVSTEFETQLQEKRKTIRELNETLDKRIISLNLLSNRAAKSFSALRENLSSGPAHVLDQQEAILDLYEKGADTETIAKKLSMPKAEVDLVLDLKKKFVEMG